MIELGKTYKDGFGNDVRIICVDRKGDWSAVGLVVASHECESIVTYTAEGKSNALGESPYDLIIPEDYSTYKIDEPVMVREGDTSTWNKRHFAGVSNGKPCTWYCGNTSWSHGDEGDAIPWRQCRRPTPEELGGNK